jgi:non-ribosomal peptide synthetase component F
MRRHAQYLKALLEGMVADDQESIDRLPLLDEAERRQLLVEWNNTQRPYPHDRCIHELFEEQVERTPDATALVHEEQSLTYAHLNSRANRLAHYLQGLGVGPDVRVAICARRGIEMVVGALATLKAGGAYMPLDPESPLERLSYMLEDAGVGVVVTQRALEDGLPAFGGQVVLMDEEWERIERESDGVERNGRQNGPESGVAVENLAYVIYTSGSTGKPKGVMVEHRNLRDRRGGL